MLNVPRSAPLTVLSAQRPHQARVGVTAAARDAAHSLWSFVARRIRCRCGGTARAELLIDGVANGR